MNATVNAAYSWSKDLTVVELPYKGGGVAMDFFMPAQPSGLSQFESTLTPAVLSAALSGLGGQSQVVLYLPKFSFTTSVELAPVLQGMGITDAFEPMVADFSGIDGNTDLSVSAVVQQALVEVDEQGTVAAAATAVSSCNRCGGGSGADDDPDRRAVPLPHPGREERQHPLHGPRPGPDDVTGFRLDASRSTASWRRGRSSPWRLFTRKLTQVRPSQNAAPVEAGVSPESPCPSRSPARSVLRGRCWTEASEACSAAETRRLGRGEALPPAPSGHKLHPLITKSLVKSRGAVTTRSLPLGTRYALRSPRRTSLWRLRFPARLKATESALRHLRSLSLVRKTAPRSRRGR